MAHEHPGSVPIPSHEIDVAFARSSGPGGQNVNKTSTKAQARWHVGRSAAFTEEQKAAIRAAAGNRLNAEDEIVVAAEAERSQAQNRDSAVARLQAIVAKALAPVKARKATKVSRAQKRARLDEKRRLGEKKRTRRQTGEW